MAKSGDKNKKIASAVLISFVTGMSVLFTLKSGSFLGGQQVFVFIMALLAGALIATVYLPSYGNDLLKEIYLLGTPYILALGGLYMTKDTRPSPRTTLILALWGVVLLLAVGIDILLDRQKKIFDSKPKKSAAIAAIFALLVTIMIRQYGKIPVSNQLRNLAGPTEQ